LLAALLWAAPATPGQRPGPVDIPALIDKLAEVKDDDVGYSPSVSGSAFAPLDAEGQVSTALLFQKPLARSETLRILVKQGAAALPHLIAHLDDKRQTGIKITPPGQLVFNDEIDRNERTEKPPARKPAEKKGEAGEGAGAFSHTVTVGDLCFVAVGQIVNRHFDAVRYQPTLWIFISSPTRTPALREQVKDAWGSLTPKQHRESLVADFLKPDSEYRRVGACKRLAYYYPDVLEPLALKFLAQPTYSVGDVWEFVRGDLYREADPKKCRALFDAYIAKHGEPSRDGILLTLFKDLERLEAHEEKRSSSPLTEFADQPRKLLIELYGRPKGVRSKDRPRVESLSNHEKAWLIEEGLIYDQSEKLDRAVRDLLVGSGDDDYLGKCCVRRLVGRGYDAEIEAYCQRRLKRATEEYQKRELREIQDQLGWTRLHVAVDRQDHDGVRSLLHTKAKVDAPARNGVTPLHLAARAGDLEAVRLLAEAGASLDPKDKSDLTPVQLAVRDDHLGVVRYLAGRGCKVPDVLVAAAAGRVDLVRGLLRSDPGAAEAKTESGQTPLHLAAWAGEAKVATVLATRAAALEKTNGEGMTPLHVAALVGSAKVAAALLDAKASSAAKMEETGRAPLHLAAAAGQAEMVDLLLSRGAGVDAVDAFQQTPLHLAAAAGQVKAAERLLAGKAAVGARDARGRTPLHVAVLWERVPMVKLLLAHKADPAAKDEERQTPLDLAEEAEQKEIIKLLGGKAKR
jgi:ankyrin repeat protein